MLIYVFLGAVLAAAQTPPRAPQAPPVPTARQYLGSVDGNVTDFATHSWSFNASTTGANFVLFTFRKDPGYWYVKNVSIAAQLGGSELFVNGNFSQTFFADNSEFPTHWGVVYQNGTRPHAFGEVSYEQWKDGSVGSFDGIYQGVTLQAGLTYNVSMTVDGDGAPPGDSAVAGCLGANGNAPGDCSLLYVYAGACADASVDTAHCTLPGNLPFNLKVTPSGVDVPEPPGLAPEPGPGPAPAPAPAQACTLVENPNSLTSPCSITHTLGTPAACPVEGSEVVFPDGSVQVNPFGEYYYVSAYYIALYVSINDNFFPDGTILAYLDGCVNDCGYNSSNEGPPGCITGCGLQNYTVVCSQSPPPPFPPPPTPPSPPPPRPPSATKTPVGLILGLTSGLSALFSCLLIFILAKRQRTRRQYNEF
jgi:hypothetical protein